MNILDYIKENVLLLDGAMGTVLQNSAVEIGKYPESLNITHPQLITSVHEEYFKIGSKLVLTNTFGASCHKLAGCEYSPAQIIEAAVKNAKTAAEKYSGYVALDIGPLGQLLEPMGSLTFEEAYEDFAAQIKAGVKAGADLIFIETMTDLYEVKAAVLAAKENCEKPVFVTMSFEQNMRTFSGTSLSAMAVTLDALGVDAMGINCSLGPVEMLPMAQELAKWTDTPLIIKPNAGMPCLVGGKTVYNINDKDFSDAMEKIMDLGVNIVGGCCGTSPQMLKMFFEKSKQKNKTKKEPAKKVSVVSSFGKTVVIDGVKIIGERINPTGKALFKKALENGDLDYIARQAVEQMNAGADILDVNVGHLAINEKEMMVKVVKKIQSVCSLPLQIDSSNADVIEAGVRVYNGKPIINSTNGEDEKLNSILPIAKKYGAAVLGLTIDENGIPPKAEDRFKIAEKIMNTALSYGIKKEDIFIDCLTLAVSAQQEDAAQTFKAVEMVSQKLNLKTTLGVSNISFGMPNRELINSSFLTLAMSKGLNMPIINPNSKVMTDAVYAFNLLYNIDKGGKEYLEKFTDIPSVKPSKTDYDITECISLGLAKECKSSVKQLLLTNNPLDIVEKQLIPALDKVGKDYENGKIFLPQLMQSANAARSGFEVISQYIAENSSENYDKKGPIVIATVKGDVHDIGKNIVKTILENYGYNVIDLGKDVDIDLVWQTAKKENAKLIGLSALMTTTVKNMEETIKKIRQHTPEIPIMVGGAVLTEDFAKEINADYYVKDAQASVEVAKAVIN